MNPLLPPSTEVVVLICVSALITWIVAFAETGREKARIEAAVRMAAAERELVDLLSEAAGYNDRGAEWYRHTAGQIADTQQTYQARQLALAQEVGTRRLGDELLSAIERGAAARDWTGDYAALAQHRLWSCRKDVPGKR